MKYTIYYDFTTLNKYITAMNRNRYIGNKIKHKETEVVRLALLNKPPFKTPCRVKFTWLRTNKKTDADNIAFCKKYILDGMQLAKIIPNDSIKHITGFIDEFVISDKEGVIIEEVLE